MEKELSKHEKAVFKLIEQAQFDLDYHKNKLEEAEIKLEILTKGIDAINKKEKVIYKDEGRNI